MGMALIKRILLVVILAVFANPFYNLVTSAFAAAQFNPTLGCPSLLLLSEDGSDSKVSKKARSSLENAPSKLHLKKHEIRSPQLWRAVFEKILLVHMGEIRVLAMSPNGEYLASASYENRLHLKVIDTGEFLPAIIAHSEEAITSVAFSQAGKSVAFGTDNGIIRIAKFPSENLRPLILQGHSGPINSVSFSATGKHVVSGSDDGSVRVWDTWNGRLIIPNLMRSAKWINSVVFSPHGQYLAAGSFEGSISIWKSGDGKTSLFKLEGHNGPINSIVFSDDEKHLFSSSFDGTIRIWKVDRNKTKSRIFLLPENFKQGSVSLISPQGRFFAASSQYNNSLLIWDTLSGQPVLSEPLSFPKRITAIAFSQDNHKLAVGFEDGRVHMYSLVPVQCDVLNGKVEKGQLEWQ